MHLESNNTRPTRFLKQSRRPPPSWRSWGPTYPGSAWFGSRDQSDRLAPNVQ